MARFVSINPEGREGRISFTFVLTFFALCAVILVINMSLTKTLLAIGGAAIVSYLLFGEGRLESGRKVRFRLSSRYKSSNFEDRQHIGEDFFEFSNIKSILQISNEQKLKDDGFDY